MYHGEVNVEQEQLSSFLTTAEMLAVQGLTDGTGSSNKDNYKEEVCIFFFFLQKEINDHGQLVLLNVWV